MATKTAYRWNTNKWYFTTREVNEDPDFPGEYNLPISSTWVKPMDDTETQWAFWTGTAWELRDLDMAGRLAEGLITQEEYDEWLSKQEDEFVSVLKERALLNAGNIALVSDVEAEATARADADTEILNSLNATIQDLNNLATSITANADADSANKSELQTAINNLATAVTANSDADGSNKTELQTAITNLSNALTANANTDAINKTNLENSISTLQKSITTLQTTVNCKANASHTHSYAGSSSAGGIATSAAKLATARNITVGNATKAFNGTGNIAFSLTEIGAVGSDCYPHSAGVTIIDNKETKTKNITYTPARDGMFLIRIPSKGDSRYPQEATITDSTVGATLLDYSNSGDWDVTIPLPVKAGHVYDITVGKIKICFA